VTSPAPPSASGAWSAAFASSTEPATIERARAPRSAREILALFLVTLEVFLAVEILDRFQIGSHALSTLGFLTLFAFPIHAFLPPRYRLAFFALVSCGAILVILGPESAGWLAVLSACLIGISVLPLSLGRRVVLLLALAGALALFRADVWRAPWSGALWPVLGSMFMFRLSIFLYDRSHGERPRSGWETLSYFFLLPNVCFPLFPTVDYKTFRRTWYGTGALACYQTGVRWITRGLVQLLLYRLLYYYFVLAPSEVGNAFDLVRHLVTNIGLYLRVSGTFHLAIGILRLFGFALPETHFLYFLSSSVNDFWRRVNIYWKDYMLKLFYLPAYFRLRRGGEARALVLSTLFVIAVTWVLHSYQVFWLQGSFPVVWQDIVFWGLLGAFMIWNTLSEQKQRGAKGRRARTWHWRNALSQGARILATFSLLAVLWSLWTAGSFAEWVDMWRLNGTHSAGETPWRGALVVGAVLGLVLFLESAAGRAQKKGEGAPSLASPLWGLASLAVLFLLGSSRVYARAGEDVSEVVQSMRVAKLNRLDAATLQRGYYEDLLDVDRFNSDLWQVYQNKPAAWLELKDTAALRPTPDFLLSELVPSSVTAYKGATLRVNRLGFRDLEYEEAKPENTVRIALLGASYVMGSGVENDQVFEALVERGLCERGPGAPERRYEIWNYAVGGYSPQQRLWIFEERALRYDPDMVMYVAHENEIFRLVRHVDSARQRGIATPYPELSEILARAGVDASTPDTLLEKRLEPFTREILGWTYRSIAVQAREHGVRAVWVFLPTLEMHGTPGDIAWMRDLAREAGFETIDLFDVYDGQDIFQIRVADWDYHPNAAGHQIIADLLLAELLARPELFR
jgi:hypothetical protein